jgi:hypothetical protein
VNYEQTLELIEHYTQSFETLGPGAIKTFIEIIFCKKKLFSNDRKMLKLFSINRKRQMKQ